MELCRECAAEWCMGALSEMESCDEEELVRMGRSVGGASAIS